jgi:hypothetical protein
MTTPKGCAMDWIILALSGDLVSLMERLSSEMSWMVKKSSEDMSSMAIRDANVTSVKKEVTSRMAEQINWLMMIHVLRFP